MIVVSCLATVSNWKMMKCFQGAPWLSAAMATVVETAEPTFTSFQPVRLFISLPLSSFCLTMKSGLRGITSDTPTASSGENHVTVVLLWGWLVCGDTVCLPVWPSILIRSGLPQDRLQEWTKMDGWGQKNDLYPHFYLLRMAGTGSTYTTLHMLLKIASASCHYQYLMTLIFNDLRRCSRTFGSGTASLCPPCRLSALVHLSEVSAPWLFLKLWVSRCISGTTVTAGTSATRKLGRNPAFHQSWFCLTLVQDSGQHLSVIDDCNDHMLTVWDWQKKSKIAEIKVINYVSSTFPDDK